MKTVLTKQRKDKLVKESLSAKPEKVSHFDFSKHAADCETYDKNLLTITVERALGLPKMYANVCTQLAINVSPAIASIWLEKLAPNRNIRQNAVERMINDLKKGNWIFQPQPIIFNQSGELIDGQHRLWAIVMSGVSMPCLVAFGWPTEVQQVVDQQANRSVADICKIKKGMSIGNIHAAVATAMITHSPECAAGNLSKMDILYFLEKHLDAIVFAVKTFTHNVRGVTVASVMAPVARAYYTANHERLRQFGEILSEGKYQDFNKDEAALKLRNYLIKLVRPDRGKLERKSLYRKSAFALQNFLAKKSCPRISEIVSEPFPIPLDESTAAYFNIEKASATV